MIRFACPQCNKTYSTSDREAGTKFACAGCGQRIQTPFPPKIDSELADPKGGEAKGSTNPPQKSPPDLKVLVIGLGLLGLAGFLLLFFSFYRSGYSKNTTEPLDGVVLNADSKQNSTSESDRLALNVREILKINCYRCHGQNGTSEGGLNYILDRDRLVSRGKIVPGKSGESKLFRRIRDGKMPPEDENPRPSPGDISVLAEWIDAGAPAFEITTPGRDFITNSEIVERIHEDLFNLGERDRRFTRYFTITHLRNAGLSEDELQTYRNALAKLVNSLSWKKEIAIPQGVDPAKTIFRIDIRDYQWNAGIWDRILAVYPFGVIPELPKAKELFDSVGETHPFIRADWFVATASRPPLYREVLQLPATEKQLEDQLHIDILQNIQQERVARAGFNSSGISRNNRMIERHASPYGSYWRSYDFGTNTGRQNLFAFPLGPGREAQFFEADGGEIIFDLPNGLHAFVLIDGTGKRLDKAPLAIVSDPRRPDRAVENGISCMTCHARGLIGKSDQIRQHAEKNLNAFSASEFETITALYPPDKKLQSLFSEDNERFRKAVEKTGASLTATEPIAALVQQFEKELDLPTAAAEAGLTPEEFADQIKGSVELARLLGALRTEGGTVNRQVFIGAFSSLVRELNLGSYLSPNKFKAVQK